MALADLKLPKGEGWGEVKCYGGGLVLAPTVHPKAADGHAVHYRPD